MSEQHPLISVILPTYNRAEFLVKAINSVVKQSFQDWELIVWDDGSSDNTKEIMGTFQDKRISYFFEANHGISYARNRAIEKSTGDYLAFLDSDDEWFEDKLMVQATIVRDHPEIEFLFGDFINHNLVNGNKDFGFKENADAMNLLKIEKIQDNLWTITNGWFESLIIDDYIATDTILMTKNAFFRAGGYNETIKNTVDMELKWRIGFVDVCKAFTDHVFLIRNKPEGSLSTPSLQMIENFLRAMDLCTETSIQNNRFDLLPLFNDKYRNAWQHLIQIYGRSGQKKESFKAFITSLKYGFRPGSVKLLVKALLGIS